MKKINFNRNWSVARIDGKLLGQQINGFPEGKEVCIPHDAMIEEEPVQDCANSTQTAHYPGGYYRYTKEFMVPAEWKNRTVTMEFEGVYMNSRVYFNNDYVGGCHSGYSNFYVNLDQSLLYGRMNRIEVLVNNEVLNSRWYTGSGLYRSVWLYTGEEVFFTLDGIRITTPEAEKELAAIWVQPCVRNEDRQNHQITVKTEILDQKGQIVAEESSSSLIFKRTEQKLYQRIFVPDPKRWDCEHPYLYTCRLTLYKENAETERQEVPFGIRKLQLDSVHGLRINGKQIKLRGACIHHDNGIIGACTLEMAEERRCRLLKEAGFNCIRSAHHPVSKGFLDACDRYGMLVMDEFSDVWAHSKNINDYAGYFDTDWELDVERMVAKNFNHPSVILYSTGNEIQEVGTSKGVEANRLLAEKIRSLDSSRYLTNGFNGLLAALDYEQTICRELLEKAAKEKKGLNDLMGEAPDLLDDQIVSGVEIHPLMTEKIDAFMGSMDIAGYNYLTLRHEMDHQRKPNRVVLGTETFPSEIVKLWRIVKNNPHVIGDMTWTGYDYLGETGLGVISYEGEQENRIGRTAWCGDLDITGKRRTVSFLREMAYGLRKTPYLAVEDPAHYGKKQLKSKWAFENSIASWTWAGYEGKPIVAEVYSPSEEVELFVNGTSLGRKKTGEAHGFCAKYDTVYKPGTLSVRAYDQGEVTGETVLETAGEPVLLLAETDRKELRANGADVAFVTAEVYDTNGRLNMQAVREITVELQGPGVLQGYGSADPYFQGSYQQKTVPSFEGRVQAAVRAGTEAGEIRVKFSAKGCRSAEIVIPVREAQMPAI